MNLKTLTCGRIILMTRVLLEFQRALALNCYHCTEQRGFKCIHDHSVHQGWQHLEN
jgi:hypothetical protein